MKKQNVCLLLGAAVLALTSSVGSAAVASESKPAGPSSSDVQPVSQIDSLRNSATSPLAAKDPFLALSKDGGASTNSVIGADSRVQIIDTKTAPNSSIVQITFNPDSAKGTVQICSGSMISPDTVLTAGHCVYTPGTGADAGYSRAVKVAPGRNGSTDPYGSCGATTLHTDQRWISSGDKNGDWGVIKLDCTVGTKTGWLNYSGTTSSLNGTQVTVRGYPGDKPFGTMWSMTGPIETTQAERVSYNMDTAGGQSGAPVYDSSNTILAIHTNGVGINPSNSGVRITPTLASKLDSLKSTK